VPQPGLGHPSFRMSESRLSCASDGSSEERQQPFPVSHTINVISRLRWHCPSTQPGLCGVSKHLTQSRGAWGLQRCPDHQIVRMQPRTDPEALVIDQSGGLQTCNAIGLLWRDVCVQGPTVCHACGYAYASHWSMQQRQDDGDRDTSQSTCGAQLAGLQ
jgi:hypothetical protein